MSVFDEFKKDFRCRLNEDCGAYGSKECLKCEHYCISYIDLYQSVCMLEDLKIQVETRKKAGN